MTIDCMYTSVDGEFTTMNPIYRTNRYDRQKLWKFGYNYDYSFIQVWIQYHARVGDWHAYCTDPEYLVVYSL